MALEKIVHSDDWLRVIMDNTLDGIVTMDENGVICFFNKAAERLFGFKSDEVVGKNVKIIVPTPDKEKHAKYLKNYLKTGKAKILGQEREVMAQHKSGQVFPLEISSNEVFIDGKRFFSAIVRDISGRKESESAIREAKEAAEGANDAKSAFLASMSHEIRTPMNGIIGMTELLFNTDLNEKQYKYTSIIYNSAEILLALINDILDLSKIESGSMDLNLAPFILSGTIEDVVQLLIPKAKENGSEVSIHYSSDVPRVVVADMMRIRQILLNLVGNAIKFTKNGHIRVNVVRKSKKGKKVVLLFEVEDSGIGIPKDRQSIIFKKFAQAKSNTASKYGGTGLGLAICRHLVEIMKGKIGVRSKEGKGSTFWFELTLPVSEENVTVQESSFKAAPKSAIITSKFGANILIVEDSFFSQEVIKSMLEEFGCKTEIAHGAKKALTLLKKSSYDLIITDCMMADMDGYEMTKKIRENKAYSRIPIVAITARALPGEKEKCLEVGMDGYLSKPVKVGELENMLNKYLKSK